MSWELSPPGSCLTPSGSATLAFLGAHAIQGSSAGQSQRPGSSGDGGCLIMTRKIMAVAILVMVAAVGVEVGFAHHGWSGYDSSQVLNLTGVIRESGYEHPHGYVKLEV